MGCVWCGRREDAGGGAGGIGMREGGRDEGGLMREEDAEGGG